MSRAAPLLALLLAGCMPAAWQQARALEGKYKVGSPGSGWVSVAPGGADHAWVHKAAGASLYTDSNCGTRFREARTQDLATELVAGLQGATQDLEVVQAIGPREGIVRTHTGRLDGMPVRLGIAVVNHDWCTYDFVLIAPLGQLDTLWPAYQAVLDGFDPVR
ncbi:hypothetical protein LBMAG42_17820 [Deltaproteobacteria bacterium]|nr:hypothetical protein LBMAG42_17820 [Deltaproteobacteria bacterium]